MCPIAVGRHFFLLVTNSDRTSSSLELKRMLQPESEARHVMSSSSQLTGPSSSPSSSPSIEPGYAHQDWRTVVLKAGSGLRPVSSGGSSRSQGPATMSSATGTPAWKVEQRADADDGKPISLVSREDARHITNRRIALKMSQRDLAVRINVDVKEVQAIEACRAVENRALLAKIRKALGS